MSRSADCDPHHLCMCQWQSTHYKEKATNGKGHLIIVIKMCQNEKEHKHEIFWSQDHHQINTFTVRRILSVFSSPETFFLDLRKEAFSPTQKAKFDGGASSLLLSSSVIAVTAVMISLSKPPFAFNGGKTDRAWRDMLPLHAPVNTAEGSQLAYLLSTSYLGGGPFT